MLAFRISHFNLTICTASFFEIIVCDIFGLRKKNGRKSPEVFKSLLNSVQICLYKHAISINIKEQSTMKTIRITTVIKIQNIYSVIYFVVVFGKKPPTTNRSSKPINKNSLLLWKVDRYEDPQISDSNICFGLGEISRFIKPARPFGEFERRSFGRYTPAPVFCHHKRRQTQILET